MEEAVSLSVPGWFDWASWASVVALQVWLLVRTYQNRYPVLRVWDHPDKSHLLVRNEGRKPAVVVEATLGERTLWDDPIPIDGGQDVSLPYSYGFGSPRDLRILYEYRVFWITRRKTVNRDVATLARAFE
ncbi:MAG: hypothetical protein OXS33_01740 [bacterium]|nr:hypothetical protein [bacterium]